MKKPEIIQKLPKLPLSELRHSDVQVILRLVTILAATHLASKVNRVIKNINKLERPEDVFKYLK
ncbi:hypothetical protein [uncultured Ruminococcus sp.]|uniref:hypothetical protein n=1 Tax=uncultured Ruminococcus sp. TaxID=165186 RepID=UPI0025E57951|nr:hypothetical protein [uncultured Ruminococcus sp.]